MVGVDEGAAEVGGAELAGMEAATGLHQTVAHQDRNTPAVGPQDGAFPAGGARVPNGIDTDTAGDWVYLSMELGGADGDHPVSPGSANAGDGDFDDNGVVDMSDFAVLQDCFTGPDNGPPDSGCDAGDFDADDDVDATDFTLFIDLFAGP